MHDRNSLVMITEDGGLKIHAQTVPEAKIAIKELKLKKKEHGLMKRELMQRQKEIRATYTDTVRQRGSKVRGGGGLGKFVRTVQTANRDAERRALAQHLAPLEQQKSNIEGFINRIDQAILKLEIYIVENS